MHGFLATIAWAALSFFAAMLDSVVTLSAQLSVTEPSRWRRASWSHALGVASLIVVAVGVGVALAAVPSRALGALCVVPWGHAAFAWRHRADTARPPASHGVIATYVTTLALGGGALALWVPLLRTAGLRAGVVTIVVFFAGELIALVNAQRLAHYPRVLGWAGRHRPPLTVVVDVALGVLVVVVARTIS